MDLVTDLARKHEHVSVVCLNSDPYEQELPNGVHTQGLRLYRDTSESELVERVQALRPTHLVSRSPIRPLLRWAASSGVRTLPLLATSFPKLGGLRIRFRYWRTARALSSSAIEVVGNHALNSCLDLKRIGVPAEKIVPWDWPPTFTPRERPPKTRTAASGPVRLFYAGVVSEDKGVGDCLAALRILRDRGLDAHFSFAGAGEIAQFQARAEALGVAGAVEFLGRIPHQRVIASMNEHDLTVVPSRHSYPEGLPLTIYDSYSSRSPLIASDHPMFRGRVEDGFAALVFEASSPESLAARAEQAIRDPGLYARLSRNSEAAWARLQLPVRWGDLLREWIAGPEAVRALLSQFSLATGPYRM